MWRQLQGRPWTVAASCEHALFRKTSRRQPLPCSGTSTKASEERWAVPEWRLNLDALLLPATHPQLCGDAPAAADSPSQAHLGRGAHHHERDADPHGQSAHPTQARGQTCFGGHPGRGRSQPYSEPDTHFPLLCGPRTHRTGSAAAPSSLRAGDRTPLPPNHYLVQRASANPARFDSRLPRVSASPLPGHDKLPPRKTLGFTNKRA